VILLNTQDAFKEKLSATLYGIAMLILTSLLIPVFRKDGGNQFLETMFAKLPILIYEYPVFESDIKPYNFNTISLGNTFNTDTNKMAYVNKSITRQPAVQAVNLLIDKEKRKKIIEENFTICKNNFSYDTLLKVLQNIFSNTSRDN